MPRSDIDELLALEARGVSWSRNQNFELFAQEGPRRALALHRRLDELAALIRRQRPHGLTVALQRVGGRYPLRLRLQAPQLAATVVVHLNDGELVVLCRDAEVAALVAEAGG